MMNGFHVITKLPLGVFMIGGKGLANMNTIGFPLFDENPGFGKNLWVELSWIVQYRSVWSPALRRRWQSAQEVCFTVFNPKKHPSVRKKQKAPKERSAITLKIHMGLSEIDWFIIIEPIPMTIMTQVSLPQRWFQNKATNGTSTLHITTQGLTTWPAIK